MERKERELLSRLKIILPGEYGFTFDGQTAIGTFAVGAKKGCRGYLIFDPFKRFAGLAHIDFPELDLFSLENIIQRLILQGSETLSIALTTNSEQIKPSLIFPFKKIIYINKSEFYYDPFSNQIIYQIPPEAKQILKQRLPILNQRLKSANKSLILVE